MDKIMELADDNVPILGICNGFQILVESEYSQVHLVQRILKFICKWMNVMVTNTDTPFTNCMIRTEDFDSHSPW